MKLHMAGGAAGGSMSWLKKPFINYLFVKTQSNVIKVELVPPQNLRLLLLARRLNQQNQEHKWRTPLTRSHLPVSSTRDHVKSNLDLN